MGEEGKGMGGDGRGKRRGWERTGGERRDGRRGEGIGGGERGEGRGEDWWGGHQGKLNDVISTNSVKIFLSFFL